MVAQAPRYDPRIETLLRRLDDPGQPMAETSRRVGAAATELGLIRPSSVHLRRLIRAERERQAEIRAVVEEVAYRAVVGLGVNPYVLEDRVREARART